jgi:hypothetical protein
MILKSDPPVTLRGLAKGLVKAYDFPSPTFCPQEMHMSKHHKKPAAKGDCCKEFKECCKKGADCCPGGKPPANDAKCPAPPAKKSGGHCPSGGGCGK